MARVAMVRIDKWHGLWALAMVACVAFAGPAVAQTRSFVRDPQKIIRGYVWSFREYRDDKVVKQQLDYSCGAAVLATIGRFYWGDNVGEAYFLDLLPQLNLSRAELEDRIQNGLTLTDLRNLAQKGGYDATMGKLSFSEVSQAKVPLIVGIIVNKHNPRLRHEHFVVLRGTDGYYVYLADPIRGNVRVPVDTFVDEWQRNAVLAIAKPNTPVKDPNPMGIRYSEIDRGWLNDQAIRRDILTPPVPHPFPFP